MISGNVPEHLKGNAMPWLVQKDGEQYCVYKKNDDGSAGAQVKCHASEDEANAHVKALYANVSDAALNDLFFTDLSDFAHISKIDGLPTTGKHPLVDMHGREVIIAPADLPKYIANTQAVLDSTKDSAGAIVGLPIDMNSHDHEGGAGWLVGLELDEARNIIKFVINWTEAGVELIKNNVRRFFSATFDPKKKIILGGSMTNKPATRTGNYEYMLSPVELSETLKELDMEKTLEERLAELEKLAKPPEEKEPPKKEEKPDGDPVELTDDENDKLAELAEKRAKNMLREARAKDEVVSFVAELAGGSKDQPMGFAIPVRKLTNFLLRLNEADRKEAQGYLKLMAVAAIDFAEHGIAGQDYIIRPKLPAEYRDSMNVWLASGKDIKSYFELVAPDLGKAEDFNLAEFAKEKE